MATAKELQERLNSGGPQLAITQEAIETLARLEIEANALQAENEEYEAKKNHAEDRCMNALLNTSKAETTSEFHRKCVEDMTTKCMEAIYLADAGIFERLSRRWRTKLMDLKHRIFGGQIDLPPKIPTNTPES